MFIFERAKSYKQLCLRLLNSDSDNRQVAAPRGPLLCDYVAAGRVWLVASNYTVTQLMHSECGRICRGPVGEGGLIGGGLQYNEMSWLKN